MSTPVSPEPWTLGAFYAASWVALGIGLKSIFDSVLKRQESIRSKKIEILEKQLNEFYWPLFAKLIQQNTIYQKLETQIVHESKSLLNLEKEVVVPICDQILTLIENKIYLARADEDFTKEMQAYIEHLIVYKARKIAGIEAENLPKDFEEPPYPEHFRESIEQETKRIQNNYNKLIQTFI